MEVLIIGKDIYTKSNFFKAYLTGNPGKVRGLTDNFFLEEKFLSARKYF